MVTTRQWQLAHQPRDEPKLDGPDATFKLVDVELPELQDGDLLIKTTDLSNDPAQRGWIDPDLAESGRLYVPPVKVGTVMSARGLAEVIESKSPNFKKGDYVVASAGWAEQAVVKASAVQPAKDLPGGLPKTHYLGALGGTGLTAWAGLYKVAEAKKDDIVCISGAAGATGSVAVQIAKNIIGCKKVIGIAGTDDKCRWVEKLGADVCLNYKSPTFKEDFKKETPAADGFIDVYFDNVAGEILDLVLSRMAQNSRLAACGAISAYNTSTERTTGIKSWFEIVIMRIKVHGFIVLDFMEDFPRALEELRQALADGKLQIEGGETVVSGSFEDVPKTWLKLFDGSNQGKLVTHIN